MDNVQKTVALRFYAELNDFLPRKKRAQEFNLRFFGNPTVKDIIESQGVPHTEIDLILVNGESVTFDYHLQAGDHISIYPEFELLNIDSLSRLRPEPLRKTAFIADAHLGKLSSYLRMIGFDTVYRNDIRDDEIITRSIDERRIILTRDLAILKNGKVTRGYFVRNNESLKQCREVIQKFNLQECIRPFSRCMVCNAPLVPAEKENISSQIPEKTRLLYSEYYRCEGCQKIYWKGSHYHKMQAIIDKLTT